MWKKGANVWKKGANVWKKGANVWKMATKKDKYEFKIIYLKNKTNVDTSHENELNVLGNQGWELISVLPYAGYNGGMLYYFQRIL